MNVNSLIMVTITTNNRLPTQEEVETDCDLPLLLIHFMSVQRTKEVPLCHSIGHH